jgi:hypothetical protein
LGIPLLLGRDFRGEDEPAVTPGESLMAAIGRAGGGSSEEPANASHICIIDEAMARHFFAGANPIGRHLSYQRPLHSRERAGNCRRRQERSL